MATSNEIIERAIKNGQKALSEYDSKALLKEYGIDVVPEKLAGSAEEALKAASEIGYPVVLKACGVEISHKTEKNLVIVDIRDEENLTSSYSKLLSRMEGESAEGVIVQKMISGKRELVIGLVRDQQFGPCVMFGLGGIFTEVLKDTSFRMAPLTENDALEMLSDLKASDILGSVRGMPAADRDTLAGFLVSIGKLGLEEEAIQEIDINPLIIDSEGNPVAVDALVVLSK